MLQKLVYFGKIYSENIRVEYVPKLSELFNEHIPEI